MLNEGVWLLACPFIPFLCLLLNVFSITLCTKLGFSHLFVLGCHTSFVTSFWILWGYIFFLVHMVGRGWRHVMLCEILSQPLWKMQGFMSCDNRPMSFCPCLSLHIVELKLCYQSTMFCTLIDIVIVDPTQVDLVSWTIFFHGVTMTITTQVTNGFYHDQFLTNMFFLLVMKVFGCLH